MMFRNLFSHSFHACISGLDLDVEADYYQDDLSLQRVTSVVQIGGDLLPARDIFVKVDGRLMTLHDAVSLKADEEGTLELLASRRMWRAYDREMTRCAGREA